MKSKKLQIIAIAILGMCLVSGCSAAGSVNTGLGSVSVGGSIQNLSFTGLFTPVENTNSSASGSANVEVKEETTNNTTNVTNNITVVNVSYTNLSSEQTQTTIEAEDDSSPTIIVLPNGQINNYTINLNQEQTNLIKSGKAVLKVKTKNNPNGEIKCKLNKK